MKKNKPNQLRIIGGKFRGRQITFPSIEGLRPTHDSIRETLFNWLNPVIASSVCLDLFCGSGALGFEALSRGAKKVYFFDSAPAVIEAVNKNLERLNVDNAVVYKQFLPETLKHLDIKADIIFLNPPFRQSLAAKSLKWLSKANFVTADTLIYLETEKNFEVEYLVDFEVLKEKTQGQVCYRLLKKDFLI